MDDTRSRPHPEQACGTCMFWRGDRAGGTATGWGECRRMPPALPPIEDDKLVHVGLWPHTDGRDWCGEWQPRTGAAADRP
jgi:hypothetical protein